MVMNTIKDYTYIERDGIKSFRAQLPTCGAEFTALRQGDGNATTFDIRVDGGQFSGVQDTPTELTVTGEWEMADLIAAFELMKKHNFC